MYEDDLVVGDAEKAAIKGTEVALKFLLECTSDLDDRKLYGSAYVGFSENSYVTVMGIALDDLWQDNKEGWQRIFNSVEVANN